jgi:RimJ/RimL family protein N-acetyltransferase
MESIRTSQLILSQPTLEDLDEVHRLHADARVWEHLPEGRHTSLQQSREMLEEWIADWNTHGIGYWIARDFDGHFVGVGGIRKLRGCWNIYYRLTPEQWHHGYAIDIARHALQTAHAMQADMPVIINVLERNAASITVAQRLGFALICRNSDPTADNAERCIYADRALRQSTVDALLSGESEKRSRALTSDHALRTSNQTGVNMSIRIMDIGDYQAVHELWLSCKGMGLNDVDDSEVGVKRFLARNPESCFVAVEDPSDISLPRVIGVIMAGNDGRRGYIYHTAVSPDHRHRGIASRLVEQVCATFQKLSISKVALVVFSANATGNGFWEKQGFTLRDDLSYRNLALRDLTRLDT